LRLTLAVLFALVLVGVPAMQARPAVNVLVNPRVSPAPATVLVQVLVEPNDHNRVLMLEADSGDYYTSSTEQLDGDNSSLVHPFKFNELPAGNYVLTARVMRSDGQVVGAVLDCLVTP
jgi:hypothetical protein